MAGGGSSSSKPVDVTPEVFKNLQGPYAQVIGQLLGFAPNQPAAPAAPAPRAGGVTQGGALGSRATGQGAQYVPPWKRDDFQPGGSSSAGGGSTTQQRTVQQGPAAGGIPSFSPSGDPNDVLRGIPKYEGPLVAGLGDNEQQLLNLLMQQQSGAGGGSPAQQALQGFLGGQAGATPGYSPNDQNAFMQGTRQALGSGYQGQSTSTTGFTPGSTPGQFVQGNRNALGSSYGGQSSSTTGYTPEGSLADYTAGLQGAQQTQGYDPNEINPMMQAYIEATQRPILEGLEETLSRTLPGRFTQAGQFIQQGEGSSAFDRAAAIATRGAAQAQADIGTRIGFETLESERGRQFTAQEGARQRESEAMAQELERRGLFGEAARARQDAATEAERSRVFDAGQADSQQQAAMLAQELERRGMYSEAARARQDAALEAERGRAFEGGEAQRQREAQMLAAEQQRQGEYGEAERGRQFTASESGQDRALDAAKALPGVSRAEIDTTIANLQAQALPRLIEQLGIEQGVEQFQNQMNELLAILGIGAGVTAPVIGQESKSKTKPNILGAL